LYITLRAAKVIAVLTVVAVGRSFVTLSRLNETSGDKRHPGVDAGRLVKSILIIVSVYVETVNLNGRSSHIAGQFHSVSGQLHYNGN